ncbi:MAG: thiamine phosphate synthase [Leptospiraceae bacterium]|nr:thiamine phosphate synthase [Leptospiraceae bacterium]
MYPILDIDFCNKNNIQYLPLIKCWENFPDLIDCFQIRAKNISPKKFEEIFHHFKKYTKIKIIINDYWQIAMELNADGIHLGKEDYQNLGKYERKSFLNFKGWKGTSSHSLEDLKDLENFWDYTGYGPIFNTTTKLSQNQTLGIENLQRAIKISKIPIVPIGGINLKNFSLLMKLNKIKPASISLFSRQEDFKKIAIEYSKKLGLTSIE